MSAATRDAGQSAASQAHPDEWAVLVAAVNKVAAEHDGEVDWSPSTASAPPHRRRSHE